MGNRYKLCKRVSDAVQLQHNIVPDGKGVRTKFWTKSGPGGTVPPGPAFKITMVVAEGVRGRRTPLPREDCRRTTRENGTVGTCHQVSHFGEEGRKEKYG